MLENHCNRTSLRRAGPELQNWSAEMAFYHCTKYGGGRGSMGGPCLMNIGDTPYLGRGVISALSFSAFDALVLKLGWRFHQEKFLDYF